MKYPLITNFIKVKLYNFEYFGEDEINDMIAYSSENNPTYISDIESELAMSYEDDSFSWKDSMNDGAGFSFSNEDEAKRFAGEIFKRHFNIASFWI